jgi:hypothetical protein
MTDTGTEAVTDAIWQRMETAPTDGTVIDVWVGGQRTTDVKWCLPDKRNARDQQRPINFCQYTIIDYDGVEGWEELGQEWSVLPTHWMPHPRPPFEEILALKSEKDTQHDKSI